MISNKDLIIFKSLLVNSIILILIGMFIIFISDHNKNQINGSYIALSGFGVLLLSVAYLLIKIKICPNKSENNNNVNDNLYQDDNVYGDEEKKILLN
jgi:hypothetical protein